MDSLTQLTIGAACAETILGKEVGRKAMLWGAILGTIPDLDVLIPFGGPVNDFVFHRGFSHSVFILTLISPLVAWIITQIHPKTKHLYFKWLLLTFVVFQVSVFIDLMTIYGTQIFWPFDKTPRGFPVLFIVDPLFTLPLVLGTVAVLVLKSKPYRAHKINNICLIISMSYLVWAIVGGYFVNYQVTEKLKKQKISYSRCVSSPAPFTTLLWRVVGVHNNQYFETYYSVFDGDAPLYVDFYSRNLELMKGLENHLPVVNLEHFTRGYFSLSQVDKNIVMKDLRMGSEPAYVFTFKVAEQKDGVIVPTKDEQIRMTQDMGGLSWIWYRIWKPLPQNMSN